MQKESTLNNKAMKQKAKGSCYKTHLCPNKGEGNFFLVSFLFAFPKEDVTFSSSLVKIKGKVLSHTDVYKLLFPLRSSLEEFSLVFLISRRTVTRLIHLHFPQSTIAQHWSRLVYDEVL